jgi:hypothetical protein
MAMRFVITPAAFIVWFASASAYHASDRPWPFAQTPAEDQVGAGTMLLGFEMVLFSLAVVLAFVFIQVSEGRRRRRAGYEP